MNILALSEKIEAKILTQKADVNREVSSGYTCDLLSWVMAHGREGMAWITVQREPGFACGGIGIEDIDLTRKEGFGRSN